MRYIIEFAIRFASTAVLALCLSSCGSKGDGGESKNRDGGDSATDTETASNSEGGDADSDGDTDTDSAGDGDSDVDSDGDTDTDSDSDTDSDVDTDSDSDSEKDTNSESETTSDFSTEPLDCTEEGVGFAYNPSRHACVDCSNKACPPESTIGIYSVTTETGQCVCETKPGFYYSNTVANPVACDKDEDGWTIITAREFVNSSDPALKANARCDVRLVKSVAFESEMGAMGEEEPNFGTEPLPEGMLPLYEPANRDDQALLSQDTGGNPTYGANGRRLKAEELNGFTKACINSIADLNGNGISDIAESPKAQGLSGLEKLYAPYAYFIELHRGAYSAEDQTYHIREKARVVNEGEEEQLAAPVFEGDPKADYWRRCVRQTDAGFAPNGIQIGMDFARIRSGDAPVMTHHSQFKCLQIVAENELDNTQPQKITAEMLVERYQLNACEASSTSEPIPGDGVNPAETAIACAAKGSSAVGDVGFAVSLYIPSDEVTPYVRGCVNECLLPIWSSEEAVASQCGNAVSFDCLVDEKDFGKGFCGCKGNFENWPDCDTCFADETNGFWAGESCEVCRENVDPNTGCTTCLMGDETGYFENSEQGVCDKCLNHWRNGEALGDTESLDTEAGDTEDNDVQVADAGDVRGGLCDVCSDHWNPAPSVEGDPSTTCSTCFADADHGYWTDDVDTDSPEADCNICETNRLGNYASGNLIENPGGEDSYQTIWADTSTPGALSFPTDTPHSGTSSIRVAPYAAIPIGGLYFVSGIAAQTIPVDDKIANYISGSGSTATLTMKGYMRGSYPRFQMTASDHFGNSLKTEMVDSTSDGPDPEWIPFTSSVVLDPTVLRDLNSITITLAANYPTIDIGLLGSFSVTTDPNAFVDFDDLSLELTIDTPNPCTQCIGGWIEQDPDTDDSYDRNCLKCPSANDVLVDSSLGHWERDTDTDSNDGDCLKCEDNETEGHWDIGSGCTTCLDNETGHWEDDDTHTKKCSVCKELFFGDSCSLCSPPFELSYDDDGVAHCKKTPNLVVNGDAAGQGGQFSAEHWTSWDQGAYGDALSKLARGDAYSTSNWLGAAPYEGSEPVLGFVCDNTSSGDLNKCGGVSEVRAYQEIVLDEQIQNAMIAGKLQINARAYVAGWTSASEYPEVRFYLCRDDAGTCTERNMDAKACHDERVKSTDKIILSNSTFEEQKPVMNWENPQDDFTIGTKTEDNVPNILYIELAYVNKAGNIEAFYDDVQAWFEM
jgi:hypothetical protein